MLNLTKITRSDYNYTKKQALN